MLLLKQEAKERLWALEKRNKKKMVSLRLSEHALEMLRYLAEHSGTSQADIVTAAIEDWFSQGHKTEGVE